MPYRKEKRDGVAADKKSLRVLCAEDNQPLAFLLKYSLQQAGHFVECVEDGQTALERLQEDIGFFDLLITDHRMPRLPGLRLVEAIRATEYRGKIIVHSSLLRPEEIRDYRALAVDCIFDKPLQTAALLHVVRAMEKDFAAKL